VRVDDAVLEAVTGAFPAGSAAAVVEILARYGVEPHEGARERVQLAIVALSQGDVSRVEELVRVAKQDYRDVLYWLELGRGHRDPIFERFYETLATPGATPRRLELLKEGVPGITRVAVLCQDGYAAHRDQLGALEAVAWRVGVEIEAVSVRRAAELEAAFSAMAEAGADEVIR
jgi:hypothetical protein